MKAKLILLTIVSLTLFSCHKKKSCELGHTGTITIQNGNYCDVIVSIYGESTNGTKILLESQGSTTIELKSGQYSTLVYRADNYLMLNSPNFEIVDCITSNCHI